MKEGSTELAANADGFEHLNGVSNGARSGYDNDLNRSTTSLRETIRDPNDPTRLLFLVWEGGRASIVRHLHKDGKVCTPSETECAALGELRMADRIMPFGDLQELLAELNSAICRFVDLSKDDVLLVSLYILSTWFPDCMKVVPYLWLVGPLGSGKTTLLKFLHCVCRRALLIGDVRPASLYKLSNVLCPTLLIDELEPDRSRMGAEVRRLLRIGNTPGVSAARNGQLFHTFSSKVISSRQPPPDVALTSRAIVIRLLPTQKDLLPLDESNMQQIARAFQPKLLMFRLQNYASVKKAQVSFERLKVLTPRIRDLAQGMAAALLSEVTLESKLLAILREHDREARIERSLEPEWLVVETLFDLCHKEMKSSRSNSHLLVGGLASHINQYLAFRGEDITINAKKTGSVLKSLGVRTRKLGNLGRGLTFTSFQRKQVHDLARRFGIDRADITSLDGLDYGYGGPPCALCEEAGLTGGLRFVDSQAKPRRQFRGGRRRQLFDQTSAAGAEQQSTSTAQQERATN